MSVAADEDKAVRSGSSLEDGRLALDVLLRGGWMEMSREESLAEVRTAVIYNLRSVSLNWYTVR